MSNKSVLVQVQKCTTVSTKVYEYKYKSVRVQVQKTGVKTVLN